MVSENWRTGVKKIHTFDVRSYVIKDTTAGNRGMKPENEGQVQGEKAHARSEVAHRRPF